MGTAFILVNNLKDSSWHARNEDFSHAAPVSEKCITKIVYELKLFAIAVKISRYSFLNILYWI